MARLIGRSCTWTVSGRWRVTQITVRLVGWRLSFAWCLGWNYSWVVARLIGKVVLGLPLADGELLRLLLCLLDGDCVFPSASDGITLGLWLS